MFQKEFWVSSAQKLKSTKYLALMALMVAMRTVVSSFYIPVGENLHISLSFILVAIDGMIMGPAAGMVTGAVTDIVSFMIMPDGMLFPGYTLTAMLGELSYALFLYHAKPTLPRVIISKLISSYLVNVLLGALWSSMLYSKGYLYYLAASFTKNTITLPFQIVILYLILKGIYPFLQKKKLV